MFFGHTDFPWRGVVVFVVCGLIGLTVMKSFAWVDQKKAEDQTATHPAPPAPQQQQEQHNSGGTNVQQQSSGNNSPNISGSNNRVVYGSRGDPEVKKRLANIESMLKQQQGDSISPKKLLAKYPLGYTIFDVDYTNSVYPYETRKTLEDWHLDFSVVSLKQIPEGQFGIKQQMYSVRVPDVTFGTWHMKDVTVGTEKKVGPFSVKTIMSLNGVAMRGEVLAVSDRGIVFLIGFVKDE